MLDLGIDLNAWPWIWLTVAVVFALIELTILGGSFILLPWAVSAFFASLLGFYDVAVEIQWAVFVFGGAVMFFGFYKWAQRFIGDNDLEPGVGANRLTGLTAIVTTEISPDDTDRRGRVSVVGEVWGALAADGTTIPVGTRVQITSVQGTRVVVERIMPDHPESGRPTMPDPSRPDQSSEETQ